MEELCDDPIPLSATQVYSPACVLFTDVIVYKAPLSPVVPLTLMTGSLSPSFNQRNVDGGLLFA